MKIFSHIKSGNLYKIIGTARCVKQPQKQYVVYKQLYDSVLRESKGRESVNKSENFLPKGTMWLRNPNDFKRKFVLTDYTESEVKAYLNQKNHK
ncbi:MAG: hypothetical protein WD512_03805 [Candidatus Paceibacterota bacterium]